LLLVYQGFSAAIREEFKAIGCLNLGEVLGAMLDQSYRDECFKIKWLFFFYFLVILFSL
jgi:hypothetical protein